MPWLHKCAHPPITADVARIALKSLLNGSQHSTDTCPQLKMPLICPPSLRLRCSSRLFLTYLQIDLFHFACNISGVSIWNKNEWYQNYLGDKSSLRLILGVCSFVCGSCWRLQSVLRGTQGYFLPFSLQGRDERTPVCSVGQLECCLFLSSQEATRLTKRRQCKKIWFKCIIITTNAGGWKVWICPF